MLKSGDRVLVIDALSGEGLYPATLIKEVPGMGTACAQIAYRIGAESVLDHAGNPETTGIKAGEVDTVRMDMLIRDNG